MTERLHFHLSLSCIGEGNGNPLQCSCLENPRNRGAWWAAIYGVAQSQTQLKRLSSSSSRHPVSGQRLIVIRRTPVSSSVPPACWGLHSHQHGLKTQLISPVTDVVLLQGHGPVDHVNFEAPVGFSSESFNKFFKTKSTFI